MPIRLIIIITKMILFIFILMIYFIPLCLIAFIAVIWKFISSEDLTNSKFIQAFILHVKWVEKEIKK